MEPRNILPIGQSGGDGLTVAALRRAFADNHPGVRGRDGLRIRGDHLLNPTMQHAPTLRPAAVLAGIVDRPEGLTVLLTRRQDKLSRHAGQFALPGGRIEPTDKDAFAAALRETHEEIGLPSDRVEIIGRLDTYKTATGFEITPAVGIVSPPFALNPDPGEVADVFEVPLDFIADTNNYRRETRHFPNRSWNVFELPFGERLIWGVTAGMLINLAEVLAQ